MSKKIHNNTSEICCRHTIGKILVDKKKITPSNLQYAIDIQKNLHVLIGEIFTIKNMCSEKDICQCLAEQHNVPMFDFNHIRCNASILQQGMFPIYAETLCCPIYTYVDPISKETITVIAAASPKGVAEYLNRSGIDYDNIEWGVATPAQIIAYLFEKMNGTITIHALNNLPSKLTAKHSNNVLPRIMIALIILISVITCFIYWPTYTIKLIYVILFVDISIKMILFFTGLITLNKNNE